LCAYV